VCVCVRVCGRALGRGGGSPYHTTVSSQAKHFNAKPDIRNSQCLTNNIRNKTQTQLNEVHIFCNVLEKQRSEYGSTAGPRKTLIKILILLRREIS
jgi:hypothetical protein